MGESAADLEVGVQPFDLAFHPSAPLVAVSLINGRLQLFKYEIGAEPQRLWDVGAHADSCRGVRFGGGGGYAVSVSADRSIVATDSESGQTAARIADAHPSSINRIVNVGDALMATGDDDGTIKIWDTRQKTCCGTLKVHEDFVSDMEYVPRSHQLLATSGDGTLSVWNLRRNKLDARSQFAEDELLSVVLAKDGRKVICGSQEGILLLYSWGHFADCSDRFVGHPNSVDALLKLDEDTVISGSSDGIVRIVSILPNKMIGIVGEHGEYPIERLAFSNDKCVLGSASHDHIVKLWDVKYLLEEDEDEAEKGAKQEEVAGYAAPVETPLQNGSASASAVSNSEEELDSENQGSKKPRRAKRGAGTGGKDSTFFGDLL